ncbi:right-handed parallel beta-helix repeat-containing protein [[Mannheimia] succiniciproducens]|uniref:Exopolygalacturonate lyase n=1 Tax=Mannheimia succiniciproducens (strain KCTC 0769BP / MBEL55E) TaxID=221988 RepID=Q65RR1_MANSM|nr:exopolygalacturonate lyase [[Mannheimia] succiniciproducens]AAU38349.1 unknown [[Mannheimia] succiniciproducens MBEL55E]
MTNKNLASLFYLALFSASSAVAAVNPSDLIWKSAAFGQSTDLNFGSTILPEKVGVNKTTVDGHPVQEGALATKFTIESRGGKLANSHEGLTYYYTELPINTNFVISADVRLEQLGPETGAKPNRQEGAGIMVRDIVGKPRAEPQPMGYEEFPAASNMVMNLLRSNTKAHNGKVNINASYREGIKEPWGTAGNKLVREDYAEGIDFENNPLRLTLEKNDQGFVVTYIQDGKEYKKVLDKVNPGILANQNADKQYLGFFASRNAKITVENVDLKLTDGKKVEPAKFTPKAMPLIVNIESSTKATGSDYVFQARANYEGSFVLQRGNKTLFKSPVVKAGEYVQHKLKLNQNKTDLKVQFIPKAKLKENGFEQNISIEKHQLQNPKLLYVATNGSAAGNGSAEKPLDLVTALELLPPGGTIQLQPGEYAAVTLDTTMSGLKDSPKTLKGIEGKVKFIGEVLHKASFWNMENIEVSGASLIVHGSHNNFSHIVTHGAPDTGFQITSPEKIGRSLWASHNTVTDSISFNNMDDSQINADGFAAKMRIGDGNSFIRCISHHNVDDGWDLFNKVEDGPNGVVTIKDSIAFMNGQTLKLKSKSASIGNGFKLGGEGLPVNHVIKNSISFRNNMDGFTDNFNPGTFTVENNVAIDNKRFNYLFRKSPYENGPKQGVFKNNRSFRFYQESKYTDVVNGSLLNNNEFLTTTEMTPAKTELLQKLQALSKVEFSEDNTGLEEVKKIQALLR